MTRLIQTALSVLFATTSTKACTTMIAGRHVLNEADGSPILIHSADCDVCDTRVGLVLSKKVTDKEDYKVYSSKPDFPRQNTDRAYIYKDGDDLDWVIKNKVMSHEHEVPQINGETNAMFESVYPLINEHGLVFGESTCTTPNILPTLGRWQKSGNGLFCVKELIRVASERCETAECAIETMAHHAMTFGFEGEGAFSGESVTVADTEGNAWIFHVLQDYSTHNSAIWAAQRIPDGHIAAIGNSFSIDILPDEPTNTHKFSNNVRSEAIAAGLWDGKGEFSFRKAYRDTGAKGFKAYAYIRMHWIYSVVAPSQKVPIDVNKEFQEMPFSVPVDRKISIAEFINVFRTPYTGQPYDLTKGVLAGPFGNPHRVEKGASKVMGEFTRAISILRTSYATAGLPYKKNPAVFYGTDTPITSVFTTFLAKTLKESKGKSLKESAKLYSKTYQVGDKSKFSFKSAWWNFDLVANFVQLNFQNMTGEIVTPAVDFWQNKMIEAVLADDEFKYRDISKFDPIGLDTYDTSDEDLLDLNLGLDNEHHNKISKDTMYVKKLQDSVVGYWTEMFYLLVMRYNDGYLNFLPNFNKTAPMGVAIGYPKEYLEEIHFSKKWIYAHSFNDVCNSAPAPPKSTSLNSQVGSQKLLRNLHAIHHN